MPSDSPTSNGAAVLGTRNFLRWLRDGLSRARVRLLALGAILLGLAAYVSSFGVVRDELCRDGVRWACAKLSCSQPALLDPSVGRLTTTISNPTEYSASILNATLNVDVGSEHFSIPLQTGAVKAVHPKDCIADSSLISTIELKSKSATAVELMPMTPDCPSVSDSASKSSTSSVAVSRNCQLTLRIRDGLGSEYSLNTKFSCSGLALKEWGEEQVDSSHKTIHASSPTKNSNTNGQDFMSPTVEQVRSDVRSYYLSGGTVVAEKDILPEAPRPCKPDANLECSVRVEVTIQDVSGLRQCTVHFAVYRNVHTTWKLDDLTGTGKCVH
jgi:hypothetical protein